MLDPITIVAPFEARETVLPSTVTWPPGVKVVEPMMKPDAELAVMVEDPIVTTAGVVGALLAPPAALEEAPVPGCTAAGVVEDPVPGSTGVGDVEALVPGSITTEVDCPFPGSIATEELVAGSTEVGIPLSEAG